MKLHEKYLVTEIKDETPNKRDAFVKVRDTIKSVKNAKQLKMARKMVKNYINMFHKSIVTGNGAQLESQLERQAKKIKDGNKR